MVSYFRQYFKCSNNLLCQFYGKEKVEYHDGLCLHMIETQPVHTDIPFCSAKTTNPTANGWLVIQSEMS